MKMEGGKRISGKGKESTKGKPLLSIITVVYNNRLMIERTIKSVVSQDYGNTEYIVIDGGSEDGTLKIIQKYEGMLDYYVSEKDDGIYCAMNKGLRMARGDIVGIISSDDFYEEDVLKTIVNNHKESPECIQYGICAFHDKYGKFCVGANLATRLPHHMIPHPTCFVPMVLYRKHGLFDESYRISADYDLMLRFYSRGEKFRFNEIVIANATRGGATDKNPMLSKREMIRARFNNGIISKREYTRDNFKIFLAQPIRWLEALLSIIY